MKREAAPFFLYFSYLFLTVFALLFGLGWSGYGGSKYIYTLFSLASLFLLFSAFRQFTSYGYSFLAVFLWLGFWLKLTVHLILNYPFVEPVGMFVGDLKQLDHALIVVIVAFLGLILGRTVFSFAKRYWTSSQEPVQPKCPDWYAKYRGITWATILLVFAVTVYVNVKFGIHLIGMLPRTIFMWPLNACIAWSLNIGFATAFTAMVWWDILLDKKKSRFVYVIIAESFFSSVAVMSRAVYIFHSLPQLFALNRNVFFSRQAVWKKILLVLLFIIFLVGSIASVTTLRNYLYQSSDAYSSTRYQVAYARWEVVTSTIDVLEASLPKLPGAEKPSVEEKIRVLRIERIALVKILEEEREKFKLASRQESKQTTFLLNEFGYQLQGGFATQIMHLSIDRWIGLEGVLSVVSYPEKSNDLFFHALTDKATPGKPDVYQKVSQSIYLKANMEIFKFASLPGVIGFLFYSGSYIFVVLGMLVFSLLLLSLEELVALMTKNPLLCSLYGAGFANNISQFGVEPRSSVSYYVMMGLGVLCVAALQLNASAIREYVRSRIGRKSA